MPETDIFPLDPDYTMVTRWSDGVLRLVTESGRTVERLKRPPQRLFELEFRSRPTADVTRLLAWWRRFERSFFTLHHEVHSLGVAGQGSLLRRSFAVTFASPPDYSLNGNEAYDIRVRLLEAVGRALDSYPDPQAGHESVFLEEDEVFTVTGSWNSEVQVLAHGGSEQVNANTNTTDAAQWVYAGYGFRLWSRTGPDLGIVEVLLDGVSLGAVDLYNSADVFSQPVLAKLDVPLGLHTLKLRATNTRNASSSANAIPADALEMMI